MFTHFLFKISNSSCIDWIGFDGSRLLVRHTNWKEQKQAFDHAYTYPCSLDQFNNLLSAVSVGKYYNDWFRFVFTAQHGTFRDLSFTYDTLREMPDVESGLPKTVGAFQTVQFYSRILGNTAFEDMANVLAVVPAAYPGARPLAIDNQTNANLVGLFVVELDCSAIIQNTQARVMSFKLSSMICSVVAVEDYTPVHGTLKDFGSCILQVPGILEV